VKARSRGRGKLVEGGTRVERKRCAVMAGGLGLGLSRCSRKRLRKKALALERTEVQRSRGV